MITEICYSVFWSYREGDKSVCRRLSSYSVEPCIEAARLIDGNPYSSDIKVIELETARSIDWKAPGNGQVLCVGQTI
jgi:hypothetical protein